MKFTYDMEKLVLKRHQRAKTRSKLLFKCHISKLSCDFATCKYVALVKFNIFKCKLKQKTNADHLTKVGINTSILPRLLNRSRIIPNDENILTIYILVHNRYQSELNALISREIEEYWPFIFLLCLK